MKEKLKEHLEEAEKKAWESLARYKFQMFGYWASIWVHLNRLGEFKKPNPFTSLVHFSKHAKINKHLEMMNARKTILDACGVIETLTDDPDIIDMVGQIKSSVHYI